MKRQLCFFLTLIVLLVGCGGNKQYDDKAPDYTQAEAWFDGGIYNGGTYDVFYIVPSCIFDWPDETGHIQHHMNVNDDNHRAAVDGPIRLASGIFAGEGNFFAPYYRQITIESWAEENSEIERRFATAFDDIVAAFDHFIEHLNNGRPFILAGHSQGGKAVIELLKHRMDDQLYSRLIAAYPLGYPVREDDVSPWLHPASDADGTGVYITFCSVSAPELLTPLLSGTVSSINPLNWQTDATPAPVEQHLGFVLIDAQGNIISEQSHLISAVLDEETGALIIEGIDPNEYYEPALAILFPPGNFHIVELNLFYRNLQENVRTRVRNFSEIRQLR